MTRHTLGSRFYVHSHDPVAPNVRPSGQPRPLVVICHGYYESGETAVRGLGPAGALAFLCEHDRDVEVADFMDALTALAQNINGNGGFWHDRTTSGNNVRDYTLTKALNSDSKKRYKGKGHYEFIDTSYIEGLLPAGAGFDIAGLHNTWRTGSTLKLSVLLETLAAHCPTAYNRLYCGFCREVKPASGCF